MKTARVLIALALPLGGLALAAWQAPAQPPSPGAAPRPEANPFDPFPRETSKRGSGAVNNYVRGVPVGLPYGASQGKKDPELEKLHAEEASAADEVNRLVAEYARTEDEKDREKLKPRLAAALTKQFDTQQKRRDVELARVEAQLKKLRELMKKRGEERKPIIDRRLDQILREAEGLGWAPPAGPRPQVGANSLPQAK